MVHIIDGSLPPFCPLCLKRFKKHYEGSIVYYICLKDMISIKKDDPYMDQWHHYKGLEDNEPIPCPTCGTTMRWFGRSDGFMKTKCPKCGMTISTGEEKDLPKPEGPQVLL